MSLKMKLILVGSGLVLVAALMLTAYCRGRKVEQAAHVVETKFEEVEKLEGEKDEAKKEVAKGDSAALRRRILRLADSLGPK